MLESEMARTRATAYPRKRHRVAVSVTFSHGVNETYAVKLLNFMLRSVDIEHWPANDDETRREPDIYITRMRAVRS